MSDLYNKASLVMNPQLVDTGKVYSIKPENRRGDFTFTRSSAATRVNADGNIEKETQNFVTQSNNFSNSDWAKVRLSVTSGQSGYDGSSDAWAITGTNPADGDASHYLVQTTSPTGVLTLSAYLKANGKNWSRVLFLNGSNPRADFDLANGTIHNITGGAIDANMESLGGGWYRCSVTANITASSSIYIYASDGNNDTNWVGDDTSGVLIQDAQLEQGLVARDVITTTTAAVEGGITDNVPRLDYTDSSCPALLLEPQRTNILENSEYLIEGSSGWTAEGTPDPTISLEEVTTPDGGSVAYKHTANATNSRLQNVLGNLGADHTYSVFVKGTGVATTFRLRNNRGYEVRYDIDTNGDFTYNGGTATSYDIEDYGNGWKRIWMVTTTSSSETNFVQIYADDAGGSGSVYVWGAQVESGSYATSYIPTYGTSVTRNADRAQILNTTTDVLSQTAFTLFFEADLTSDTTNNFKDIVAFRGASKELRFETRTDNSVRVQSNMITSGDSWNSATIGDTDNKKFAMTFTTSQVRLYADGSLVNTYNGAYSSDLVHILFMNSTSSGVETKTSFKQYILFTTALSNQEAIALTTI